MSELEPGNVVIIKGTRNIGVIKKTIRVTVNSCLKEYYLVDEPDDIDAWSYYTLDELIPATPALRVLYE